MQALGTFQSRFQPYRGRLTLLIVLLAALYFVIAFAGQALHAREMHADIEQHRATLATMQGENAALQQQVDRYATDAYYTYVEQRARRDLLLANSGETLVLIDWQPSAEVPVSPAATAPQDDTPNWKRWIEVFDRR